MIQDRRAKGASMDLHVGVMAHAVPDAPRIAFPAVEVIAVEQPVLVTDGLLQGQADSAMSTGDPFRLFLFHNGPVQGGRVSRPVCT